jgi:RNA polymerase sigma factor (sigma-70 family)
MLYERYYGYAFSIALRYICRYEGARFVVNDAFIKVFRNMHRFEYVNTNETEPQLKAWLKKIVVNTAIDELRHRDKPFESLHDRSAGAACYADHPLLYKELVQQVKTLPKAYRTVFKMHAIDGFKHFEIAQRLGISVGTSKSNLSKAKICLRKLIKAETEFSLS